MTSGGGLPFPSLAQREVDDARVEKLVSRLRGRIEPDPAAPRYLVTVRGRGYKLLSRPQEA